MKTSEARIISKNLSITIETGDLDASYAQLVPILEQKTPFSALDLIGRSLGEGPIDQVNNLLERLAADKTMGGWVVIACALREQLVRDFKGAIDRCRSYIISADSWYGADIHGERVPGPALVQSLPETLDVLSGWRIDPNRWVRRTVGVSVHYWAKRSRRRDELIPHVEELLDFLSPIFSEGDLDAAKGIGWGLKTLARYYPDVVTPWLIEQISKPQLRYRAVMLRKATTYLPDDQKNLVMDQVS